MIMMGRTAKRTAVPKPPKAAAPRKRAPATSAAKSAPKPKKARRIPDTRVVAAMPAAYADHKRARTLGDATTRAMVMGLPENVRWRVGVGFEVRATPTAAWIRAFGLTKWLDDAFTPPEALRGRGTTVARSWRSSSRERGTAVDAALGRAIDAGGVPLGADPYLVAVWRHCTVKLKLRFLGHHVRLGHPRTGVATEADFVAVHVPTGRPVVGELKTGHDAGLRVAHGAMRPPFSAFPASLSNKYHAQLAWACAVLEANTSMRHVLGVLVIVNAGDVSSVAVRPSLRGVMTRFLAGAPDVEGAALRRGRAVRSARAEAEVEVVAPQLALTQVRRGRKHARDEGGAFAVSEWTITVAQKRARVGGS